MSIKSNIEYVNELKNAAAEKSGRTGEDVLLVAVTKLHSPEEINEAIDAGVTDIGENKVQEILDKYDKRYTSFFLAYFRPRITYYARTRHSIPPFFLSRCPAKAWLARRASRSYLPFGERRKDKGPHWELFF